MAATKIPCTDVAKAAFPTGTPFTVFQKGTDLYLAGLRLGGTVQLVASDGEVEASIVTGAQIGPLANFVNASMMGQPMHYATRRGQDPLAMFDSLEALAPTDKKAVDPRTIYSMLTVTLPMPAVAPVSPLV